MSAKSKNVKKFALTAALVVLLAALAYAAYRLSAPPIEIPAVQTSAMEPQVAALIESSVKKVRTNPDSADAWGKLAQVYHAHKLYAPALVSYEEAIAREPARFRWRHLAAHAQAKINVADAIPLFEIARDMAPDREYVNIALADALMAAGRTEEAQRTYRSVLEQDKDSVFAVIGLARLALPGDDLSDAVARLQRAQQTAPQHGEVHTLLAQLYRRQGELEKAQEAERLSRIHSRTFRPPDPVVQAMENMAVNSTAIIGRGVKLAEEGNFKAAETQFRKALAIKASATAHANLASALLRQGKTKASLAEFEKARGLDAGDSEMLSNYGLALLQAGQSAKAEETLNAALQADAGNASAHFNMGLLRETQGRDEIAIEAYGKALELDPGLADAYLNLGAIAARQGELEGAIEAWEAFRLLKPEDPAAIYNIGQARKMLGQHAEAIQAFRDGLNMAPNSSRFVAALAWELATAPPDTLRDGEQALALTGRLLAARPGDPAVLDLHAAALAETGSFDQAISTAERALQAANSNPALAMEIRQRLALYRQGKAFRPTASQLSNNPDSE